MQKLIKKDEIYAEMSQPFADEKDAFSNIEGFSKELEQLRIKYRIAEMGCVVLVYAQQDGKKIECSNRITVGNQAVAIRMLGESSLSLCLDLISQLTEQLNKKKSEVVKENAEIKRAKS